MLFITAFIFSFLSISSISAQYSDSNSYNDQQFNALVYHHNNQQNQNNLNKQYRGLNFNQQSYLEKPPSTQSTVGFMQNAREAIQGPAGQIMVHMAKELISRSAGNSQV